MAPLEAMSLLSIAVTILRDLMTAFSFLVWDLPRDGLAVM
jgi:hypothetical protein